MNDVPPEVQAMHQRLFEKYINVLLDQASRSGLAWPILTALCDRIERLLALDEIHTRAKYAYLTSRDYDALDEFRTLARDIIDQPVTLDEYMEEGPYDPAAGEPAAEPESVVPEVPLDEGRGDEGEPSDGLADDVSVGLPIVQPSADLRADEGRCAEGHQWLGTKDAWGNRICDLCANARCFECGFTTASLSHQEKCCAAPERLPVVKGRRRPFASYSEAELDAFWESRPDLTREQARKQLIQEIRGGLVLASHGEVAS